MKVQLTVASCDGSRILNLQQFTDLKVINNLATNEVVEPVYQMLINQVYDDTKKYLAELESSYKAKYGSLESVYAKSKASLEQYLINAENGGNAEFLQGYNPKNFNRVENTINELINSASSKYKVGDVVEVLGYYTAGDGAHHKRKIESADDGSGVQLANGLWANIVHNGEVNVSWFGAKGDGVTDDTVSIYKAHAFTNETDFHKVVYKKGVYNVSPEHGLKIPVKCSVDFCDSKLVIKVTKEKFETIFISNIKTEWQDFEVESKINKGHNFSSAFRKAGKNSIIELYGDVVFENDVTKNVKDRFFHIESGCVIGSSFFDRELEKTFGRRRNMSKPITIENVEIFEKYDGNPLDLVEKFYWTTFSFTEVDNMVLQNIRVDHNNFVSSRSCFHITGCYNLKMDNINFANYTKLGNDQGVNSAYGYFAQIHYALNVQVNNFISAHTMEKTWSSLGMSNIKKIHYSNCVAYRPDTHSLCQDLSAENCIFSSIHLSGDGYRNLKNVTFNIFEDYTEVFHRRGESLTHDFNYFDGDIILENCNIFYSTSSSVARLFSSRGLTSGLVPKTTMFRTAKIKNLKLVKDSREKTLTLQCFNPWDTSPKWKELIFEDCNFSKDNFAFGLENSEPYEYDANKNYMNESENLVVNFNCTTSFLNCVFNEELYYLEGDYLNNRGIHIRTPKFPDGDKNKTFYLMTFDNCRNVVTSGGFYGVTKINNCTVLAFKSYIRPTPELVDLNFTNFLEIKNSTFYFEPNSYLEGPDSSLSQKRILVLKGCDFVGVDNLDQTQKNVFIQLVATLNGVVDYNNVFYKKEENYAFLLDTPYYATKMQQEGIYEDFVTYMDSKLEYDKEQRYLEEQRQLAFESREDQEQTYEEWLATQPVLIPDNEPQPSEKLLEFKNKYIV